MYSYAIFFLFQRWYECAGQASLTKLKEKISPLNYLRFVETPYPNMLAFK